MDGASEHKRAFSFCFLVPFLCVASINQWQASFLIRMTLAYMHIYRLLKLMKPILIQIYNHEQILELLKLKYNLGNRI